MKYSIFLILFLVITVSTKNHPSSTNHSNHIHWIEFDQLASKIQQETRPVFISIYSEGCGWCKAMDKMAFKHPDIIRYINKHFYAIKWNSSTKYDVQLNGQTYQYTSERLFAAHNLTKFLVTNNGGGYIHYPAVAFLDEHFNRIEAYTGYKDAQKLDYLLRFINEKHYLTKSLSQFKTEYQSPIPPDVYSN